MAERSLWTALHAQIHITLRSRRLLPQNQRLLVAVSGGQDSLCLIKLLLDLQPKWGWGLAIGHCDHRWREDSKANAEFVRQLAQNWNLPFYCQTAAQISTSEAEARQWRYEALGTIAQEQGYAAVITGHTASDRAETLLYNLMRGSGMDGLQALAWQRELIPEISLVRPLLELTRTETAAFCQQLDLRVWEDATNYDLKYARNRIRHELLPYLQTHFNPQVESALARTAELLQADVEYLDTVATALRQHVQHSTLPQLQRHLLKDAPLAIQRRVMRQFLEQVLSYPTNFAEVEKGVVLITAPNRSRTDPFPGGEVAEVQGEWICLCSA